jgi:hypothetical protein
MHHAAQAVEYSKTFILPLCEEKSRRYVACTFGHDEQCMATKIDVECIWQK